MENLSFLDLFQGLATLFASDPKIMIGRIFLMLLGFLLIYLGSKSVLEPLLMIPMGLGMASINAGVTFLEGGKMGTLFVDPVSYTHLDVYKRQELDVAQDRAARAAELAQDYRDEFASPYEAASNFFITDFIEPCDTRSTISLALRKTLTKRELRPNKKHGNMPL